MKRRRGRRLRVTLTEEGYHCLQRVYALRNRKALALRRLPSGKIEVNYEISEEAYRALERVCQARRANGELNSTISEIVDEACRAGWDRECQRAIVRTTPVPGPVVVSNHLDLECGHDVITFGNLDGVEIIVCPVCRAAGRF